MFPWSVIPRAGWPSAAAAATTSAMRAAPSSIEYSVCTWRCVKLSTGCPQGFIHSLWTNYTGVIRRYHHGAHPDTWKDFLTSTWKEFGTSNMTSYREAPLPEKRRGRSNSRDIALVLAAYAPILIVSRLVVDERERVLIDRAITFGYGVMANAGAPRLSMFSVWPLMGTMWIVARFVAPRMP